MRAVWSVESEDVQVVLEEKARIAVAVRYCYEEASGFVVTPFPSAHNHGLIGVRMVFEHAAVPRGVQSQVEDLLVGVSAPYEALLLPT